LLLVSTLTFGSARPASADEKPGAAPEGVTTQAGYMAGPIAQSALRQIRSESLSRAAQGGSSGGRGTAIGLVVLGAGLMGVGGGVGAYGVSDRCYASNLIETCDRYTNTGIGFLLGGLGVFIAGAIMMGMRGGRNAQSAPPPQSAPRTTSSAPVFIPSAGDSQAREAVNDIRQGAHDSMPQAQCEGSSPNGMTVVSYENRTNYGLSISLAGASALTLNIPSGQTRTATVQSGRYEIGARASSPSVRPLYDAQNLRGRDCSWFFYIQ
jgi:hypothetical protein